MAKRSLSIHLNVLLNREKVGTLIRKSSGQVSFEYSPSWVEGKAIPISFSMPIQLGSYSGSIVSSFFGNLLPDNDQVLERLAEKLGANSLEPVELLRLMGKDCVGALQFVPEDESISAGEALKFEELDESAIHRILSHLSSSPLGIEADDDFRISIAGAQEKTALLLLKDKVSKNKVSKNKWCRPLGVTPSTHILKPRLGVLRNGIDLSTSAENEWICLKIAAHFGLDVPCADVLDFKSIRCLVVERFDRAWSGSTIVRLPQEDFCQAQGIPSTKKYESRGGAGIPQIMRFLNSSDYRDKDRTAFFKAQLLFYLLAATDGHAKNFSIFLSQTGFFMTPIYDILSLHPALVARQIEKKEAKLAMAIGKAKHYRISEIQRRHWLETAKESDLSEEAFDKILDEIKEKAKTLENAFERVPSQISDDLIGIIIGGMRDNLKGLL
jgi:serine/threonine-protein kinase HipA